MQSRLLTKRERVLRAVRFQKTDRTPVYDILQNDAVIEHYAGQRLKVENGLRVKGLAIGRTLDATRMPEGPAAPGIERWENGIVIQRERWTSWIIERPFHDVPGLIQWIKGDIQRTCATLFDSAYAKHFHDQLRERMALSAAGDPTGRNDPTVMIVESGVGLTEMYWLAGMELFSYLIAEAPDWVEEWLDARHRAELCRVACIADPALIPIALTYDDIAYKSAPLFSPAWLRRLWTPRLKQLIDAWHERGAACASDIPSSF